MRRASSYAVILPVLVSLAVHGPLEARGGAWARHIIDDSSNGADGVRLNDANGDGKLDIVTGWEEGGVVRLYLQPKPSQVRHRWPKVTVGAAPSVEDAVLIDLDGDGHLDVLSSSEGEERTLHVHWSPVDPKQLLEASRWQTEPFTPSLKMTRWMFALPMDIDHQDGIDFIAGSKEPNGTIGWWQSPDRPRQSEAWRWHPLRPAGWVMSLIAADMNGDGALDLLFSDRKGPGRGCFWLERPPHLEQDWPEHPIGGINHEVMFVARADLNGDKRPDVSAAVRPDTLLISYAQDEVGLRWEQQSLPWPSQAGQPKAVAIGDINADGRPDLVCSCERAAKRVGVFWLELQPDRASQPMVFHDISGLEGTKFDLIQLLDLDSDGDLDVLTCEEQENLGVIWYENPTLP